METVTMFNNYLSLNSNHKHYTSLPVFTSSIDKTVKVEKSTWNIACHAQNLYQQNLLKIFCRMEKAVPNKIQQ